MEQRGWLVAAQTPTALIHPPNRGGHLAECLRQRSDTDTDTKAVTPAPRGRGAAMLPSAAHAGRSSQDVACGAVTSCGQG